MTAPIFVILAVVMLFVSGCVQLPSAPAGGGAGNATGAGAGQASGAAAGTQGTGNGTPYAGTGQGSGAATGATGAGTGGTGARGLRTAIWKRYWDRKPKRVRLELDVTRYEAIKGLLLATEVLGAVDLVGIARETLVVLPVARSMISRVKNPDPTRCVAQFSDHDSRWPHFYQCRHERVRGEFCKRHAPRPGREVWYRIDVSFMEPKITREEFTGSTPTQLIAADGRRTPKSTQYHRWFPTFEEAKEELVKRYERKLLGLRGQVGSTERALQAAAALSPDAQALVTT